MITVDYCVCCDSKNLKVIPGRMSYFVIDRMTSSEEKRIGNWLACDSITCLDCNFVFSNVRFNRDEESNYYKNYMQDDYIAHRCEYETSERASFYKEFRDEEYQETRRRNTYEFLSKSLSTDILSSVQSVLDYGGDTGKLIPKEFIDAKKYVIDVEHRTSQDDVEFIKDPAQSGLIDLVISSHTLEHVSYPKEIMYDIKRYMKSGSYFIIEVPDEFDEDSKSRIFHEHINYWTEKSLVNFLEKESFEIIATYRHLYHRLIGNVIIIVCKLK